MEITCLQLGCINYFISTQIWTKLWGIFGDIQRGYDKTALPTFSVRSDGIDVQQKWFESRVLTIFYIVAFLCGRSFGDSDETFGEP